MSQIHAAKLLDIKQPDLSNILRGHYRGILGGAADAMLTAFDPGRRDHHPAPP
jgi:predicted XRE-type DNA-binding protein